MLRSVRVLVQLEARQAAPPAPRAVKSVPATGPGSVAALQHKLADVKREKERMLREMDAM